MSMDISSRVSKINNNPHPCRMLVQYWSLEGDLLAEHDLLDDLIPGEERN